MRFVLAVTVVVLSTACTSAPQVAEAPGSEAVPERELGLSRAEVLDEPAPAPVADNPAAPGESELRARSHPGAAPVIPHSVAGLDPIRLDSNDCLGCHDRALADDFGAPAVPGSHYLDLRHAPASQRAEIAGTRAVCTTCHVAQTLSEPLVEVRKP